MKVQVAMLASLSMLTASISADSTEQEGGSKETGWTPTTQGTHPTWGIGDKLSGGNGQWTGTNGHWTGTNGYSAGHSTPWWQHWKTGWHAGLHFPQTWGTDTCTETTTPVPDTTSTETRASTPPGETTPATKTYPNSHVTSAGTTQPINSSATIYEEVPTQPTTTIGTTGADTYPASPGASESSSEKMHTTVYTTMLKSICKTCATGITTHPYTVRETYSVDASMPTSRSVPYGFRLVTEPCHNCGPGTTLVVITQPSVTTWTSGSSVFSSVVFDSSVVPNNARSAKTPRMLKRFFDKVYITGYQGDSSTITSSTSTTTTTSTTNTTTTQTTTTTMSNNSSSSSSTIVPTVAYSPPSPSSESKTHKHAQGTSPSTGTPTLVQVQQEGLPTQQNTQTGPSPSTYATWGRHHHPSEAPTRKPKYRGQGKTTPSAGPGCTNGAPLCPESGSSSAGGGGDTTSPAASTYVLTNPPGSSKSPSSITSGDDGGTSPISAFQTSDGKGGHHHPHGGHPNTHGHGNLTQPVPLSVPPSGHPSGTASSVVPPDESYTVSTSSGAVSSQAGPPPSHSAGASASASNSEPFAPNSISASASLSNTVSRPGGTGTGFGSGAVRPTPASASAPNYPSYQAAGNRITPVGPLAILGGWLVALEGAGAGLVLLM